MGKSFRRAVMVGTAGKGGKGGGWKRRMQRNGGWGT